MRNSKNEKPNSSRRSGITPPKRDTFEINNNRRTNIDGKAETSIRIPKENDDKPKR